MDVTDPKHDYIRLAGKVLEDLTGAQLPGRFWIHFLPILKHIPSWVPGAYFRRFVEQHHLEVEKMLSRPFETVKKEIVSYLVPLTADIYSHYPSQAQGRADESVVAALIERLYRERDDREVRAEKEELARGVAGIAYLGLCSDILDHCTCTLTLHCHSLRWRRYGKLNDTRVLGLSNKISPDYHRSASLLRCDVNIPRGAKESSRRVRSCHWS